MNEKAMREKDILRRIMIRLRKGMDEVEHTQLSDAIYNNVVPFFEKHYGHRKRLTVGLYYPIHREVNTIDIIKYVLSSGWSVYLPVISDSDLKIRYKKFESFKNMKEGPFGIMEPKGSVGRFAKSLDVLFVPGLAFDTKGYRVGYGKGYFDKYLSENGRKKTITVGLCFNFQIISDIPIQKHDVKLDYVITENKIIKTDHKNRS